MSKAFRPYAAFLIVPSIVFIFSILLKSAAGPYWLASNFDPAYQYLVNGLRLLKGLVPNHTDHPGTPLQMLCGAVCWVFNIGHSVSQTATRVFISPEFYLHTVCVVLAGLAFCTSFLLAAYVYRKTNDGIAALLTQLPVLSFLILKSWDPYAPFSTVLPVVANVFPETLLISVVNLFNMCLLKIFFAKASKDEYPAVVSWGFISGLGVAVKITFIPLLVIPWIILSWKNKIIFTIVLAASFILWTLPIVSVYPTLWHWVVNIVTHKGSLGLGGAGLMEKHEYFMNWGNIFHEHKILIIFLFLAMVLCFGQLVMKKWGRETSFICVTAFGIILQFAAVAKNPGMHYLSPGMGLFSVLFFLLYWQGASHHPWAKRIVGILVLVSILLGTWQANAYRLKLADAAKDMLAFYQHIHEEYKGFNFVGFYRSSGQEAALSFGDQYSGSWDELFKLYPDSYIFNRWTIRMRDFRGRVFSNDVMSQHAGVILQGDGDYDFGPSPYTVELLEKGRFESVFLLKNTTEKQAVMLHIAAIYLSNSGDSLKALEYDAEAKALHYPLP